MVQGEKKFIFCTVGNRLEAEELVRVYNGKVTDVAGMLTGTPGLNDMCVMGELLGACIHYGTLLVNSFFQRVSSEKWLENFFDTVRGENSEYRPILIRSEENTLFKETGYIMAYAKSDEYDPLEIIKNKPAYQFAQLSTVPKSEVDINIPIIDVLREY